MGANVLIAGDCGPAHGPEQGFSIEGYTQLVLPVLQTADFRLANCMRTYSMRTISNSDAPQVGQPIVMADIYKYGCFDGVTMANNHAFDSGATVILPRALFPF